MPRGGASRKKKKTGDDYDLNTYRRYSSAGRNRSSNSKRRTACGGETIIAAIILSVVTTRAGSLCFSHSLLEDAPEVINARVVRHVIHLEGYHALDVGGPIAVRRRESGVGEGGRGVRVTVRLGLGTRGRQGGCCALLGLVYYRRAGT